MKIKEPFFSLTQQLWNQNLNIPYTVKPKETLLSEFGTFFLNKVENIVTKTRKIVQNERIDTIVDYILHWQQI